MAELSKHLLIDLSCINGCGGPRSEEFIPEDLTKSQPIYCDWCGRTDLFVPSLGAELSQEVESAVSRNKEAAQINKQTCHQTAALLFLLSDVWASPLHAHEKFRTTDNLTSLPPYKECPWWEILIDSPDKSTKQSLQDHMQYLLDISSGRVFGRIEQTSRYLREDRRKGSSSETRERMFLWETKFNAIEFKEAIRICRGEIPYDYKLAFCQLGGIT